jgi:salicylate hydroxylase
MSVLLDQVQQRISHSPGERARLVEAAFESLDELRRPRTQWLVNSSRRVCDLYHQQEWADPARWVKAGTCFEEIRDRSYKIWNFDVPDMVRRTEADFERRVVAGSGGRKGGDGNGVWAGPGSGYVL